MKVLQVITSLNTGGAEKLILDSVPLYQKKGITTDVLSLNANETSFWQQLKGKSNGKLTGLTKKSVYNPLLVFKIMPHLKKYDVIHVHLFPALYWVVLAKVLSASKTPIVYTEHSTHNKRRESKVFQLVDKFMYGKTSFIGCISNATKTNLIQHLSLKKVAISVIQNGIDLNEFIEESNNDNFTFFKKDDFVLIQISSFREQKDQPTLIRALKKLPDNIKLLLIGDGHLKKDNQDLAISLEVEDRVLFLGLRNDIPKLLRYADVCILSSHYEGFGLAILEGMASGKPSIASNLIGVREIVEGYGLLFEKGNAEELAQLISKLYHDQDFYNQTAKKCLDRAKEFDISKMVEKYIKIYKLLTE